MAKTQYVYFSVMERPKATLNENCILWKGANLVKCNLIPVPPGFTISTEVRFTTKMVKYPDGLREVSAIL